MSEPGIESAGTAAQPPAIADLMEVFSGGRATVYRTLDRAKSAGIGEAG